MSYLGDFALSSNVDLHFTTVNTSGVPTQLAGTPVVSAYPDNSTTQLTAGITLTVDFDTVTGLNHVRVVASGANGYAAASTYTLVITTGTVSGSSVVGYVIGSFSIEARSALRPTTAGRTLDVSAGGEAGLDWANVGSPTTTVGLSGTTVKTATDVETDTADIQTRLPAALVSGRIDASVGAMATDTLTAAALAADAVTEIQSGLATAAALATVAGYIDTEIADIQSRLPAALTAGGNIKADALAVSGSTASADNLERGTLGTVLGTVGAASTTTSIVTSSLDPAAAVTDQFKGRIVTFDRATTTANLRGQATDITASTALGVLTVTALTDAPASGDTFTIT